MTTLADLFPGFEVRRVACGDVTIHARVGGNGPPLLLLHGYPQTHVCWHKVAPELERHFTLVLPDLRGYGDSTAAPDHPGHETYAKRAMAADCIALMAALGHRRFAVVSHDRGARVGYRLALDHPDAVTRLVVLDIVTTHDAWEDLNRPNAIGRFHWSFLARPAPFPETMIARDPVYFLDYLLTQWTAAGDLSVFDPRALEHYRHHFARPEVIHATCEDYRAGATCDVEIDAADLAAGRTVGCPMLSLWGASRAHGFVNAPLEAWRRWCPHVRGEPIISGHFLAEEQPDATLARIVPFLTAVG